MPIRSRHLPHPLARRLTVVVTGVLVGALTGASVAVGAPASAARSGVWPLQPRPPVVAGFDPPATPFGRGHRGVDLLGRTGQAVHTALPGRVSFAAVLAGRGVVVVDHGDVRTTYEPVAASVHVGEVLAGGAVVGTLVARGSHCFPRACLHWGLLRGPTYLDPLTLVGAGPVRLLPLDGAGLVPAGGSPVARRWPAGWAAGWSEVPGTARSAAIAPLPVVKGLPAHAV